MDLVFIVNGLIFMMIVLYVTFCYKFVMVISIKILDL